MGGTRRGSCSGSILSAVPVLGREISKKIESHAIQATLASRPYNGLEEGGRDGPARFHVADVLLRGPDHFGEGSRAAEFVDNVRCRVHGPDT